MPVYKRLNIMGGTSCSTKPKMLGTIWSFMTFEQKYRYLSKVRFMHEHRLNLMKNCRCWSYHPAMNFFFPPAYIKFLTENGFVRASYWAVLAGDSLASEMFASGNWDNYLI